MSSCTNTSEQPGKNKSGATPFMNTLFFYGDLCGCKQNSKYTKPHHRRAKHRFLWAPNPSFTIFKCHFPSVLTLCSTFFTWFLFIVLLNRHSFRRRVCYVFSSLLAFCFVFFLSSETPVFRYVCRWKQIRNAAWLNKNKQNNKIYHEKHKQKLFDCKKKSFHLACALAVALCGGSRHGTVRRPLTIWVGGDCRLWKLERFLFMHAVTFPI